MATALKLRLPLHSPCSRRLERPMNFQRGSGTVAATQASGRRILRKRTEEQPRSPIFNPSVTEQTASVATDKVVLPVAATTAGHICAIRGPVVDVAFPPGEMPHLLEALKVATGQQTLILEVQLLLGGGIARTVALGHTDGL